MKNKNHQQTPITLECQKHLLSFYAPIFLSLKVQESMEGGWLNDFLSYVLECISHGGNVIKNGEFPRLAHFVVG